MSDPVTNVEIEDVLSSIRRLVSEDARVRPMQDMSSDRAGGRSDILAKDNIPSRDAPGKLVLTPALRVTDSEIAPQDTESFADDLSADDDAQDLSTAVEADQSDHAHPAAPFGDDHFPEHSEDEAVAEPAAPADAGQEAESEDVAQSVDAMRWEDHQDRGSDHETLLLDDGAFVEDAEEVADTDLQDTGAAPVEASEADETPLEDGDRSSDEPLRSFVFSSVRDAAEQGTIAQEDTAEAFSEADSAESLFADDETVLDEEMLRELVTEIVRQELQGALGERITRNVRKLVRREIHRALTSHELE